MLLSRFCLNKEGGGRTRNLDPKKWDPSSSNLQLHTKIDLLRPNSHINGLYRGPINAFDMHN